MKSPLFSLNFKDFFKGLFLAILTAVVTIVYTSLQASTIVFDWHAIGVAAITSGLAYIMKNLLTNSDDQILKAEKPKE